MFGFCWVCNKVTKHEWEKFAFVYRCRVCNTLYKEAYPEYIYTLAKKHSEVFGMPVRFSEIAPKKELELPEKQIRIEKLIDEEFEITKVYILPSKFRDGNYAIVVAKQKKKEFYFTTTSQVLLKQLEKIKEICDNGESVIVTLRKIKKYYTFE